MSTPTPALVSQRAARRLPRTALLLLCAAYVLPGVFGRDPWRGADLNAFGTMLGMAEGRSSWLAPTLGGVAADAALLPYWLGAVSIQWFGPWFGPALAARLPFAALLALVLALTWYSAFHLARTGAAQPVAFAFGGEAAPLDYARAVADAALLALIACLGLLQLGHETTPELAQLFGSALFLWSLAAAPFRVWPARIAGMAALLVLSGSAAPMVGLALAAAGGLACLRSESPQVRALVPWIALGALAAALLATSAGVWAWRVDRDWSLVALLDNPRLWVWFMWPAWLLAAWTLWRWRSHLQRRHVAVPAVSLLVPMLASVVMGASDRALLLGLPGVAVLAAFALPTLNRSTSAAIDWFSMILFTLGAVALWAVYLSLHLGVPPKPAVHVERLLPGFAAALSWPPLLLAGAATVCWFWLVRWRTGRHRDALWKSLVLPAGGVALCWLLLMTLGLPMLDYARSYRTLVERVARHVPRGECVAAPAQPASLVAALEFHGGWRVDARPGAGACRYLVRVESRFTASPAPAGWRLVAKERRPIDRNNLAAIYVRNAAR